MRAGLSIIQQILTPEAATILNQSVAEACRRTHGQTTPLHVAATLLSSPSGFLRQACIRSHPNSSHPLQCRALELCFSVALERLPTVQQGMEPPISNALMAALKRAQAHQRRGCPEQQQQPLLAVKVELDQLIISILDDPSVSRVMREASFSSPAVKAIIEQLLSTSNSHKQHHQIMISNPNRLMQNPNPYLNPRFHWGDIDNSVTKLLEIMARSRKRNPILVGDSEPETVVMEFLRTIKSGDNSILKNVTVISTKKWISSDKSQIAGNIKELGEAIESIINNGGVIVDLGDLKSLVEKEQQPEMVVEISKLLARFRRDHEENKVWLIGTATCETYLRCQVYHSTMEIDWDIQAVPIASRSPFSPNFSRLWSNTVEPFTLARPAPATPVERGPFCPQCSENYEKESAKLTAIHKSFSEASLPQWLQNAKLNSSDAKTQDPSYKNHELQKKWMDVCLHLHPDYHHNRQAPPMLSNSPNLLKYPDCPPMMKPLGEILRLDTSSPPQSPVRTDLVLGRISSQTTAEKPMDADMYKKLLKSLMEKAWWQGEAASAVASSISHCRLRSRKHRGDIWLLFAGPDKVGKKKMAVVIAEQVCRATPVIICLGARQDDEEPVRGKTVIDRVAEAIRGNPFSVIMLQDIDEANHLTQGKIKRAVERGRIDDSHGREVGLGNTIFLVTGNWSTTTNDDYRFIDGNWRLGLVVREKTSKRRWLDDDDEDRQTRHRGSGLSLDLNLASSEDLSDVTIDHDEELSPVPSLVTSVPHELLDNVDDSIIFKPVDSVFVRRKIKKKIFVKFSAIVGGNVSLEVEDDVLDTIFGGLWHDQTSLGEWIEKVLEPSFEQLRGRVRSGLVVRLVVEADSSSEGRRGNGHGDWLPCRIIV